MLSCQSGEVPGKSTMSHDAFVSYASSDRGVAYRMVDYLESCGIRCWVAPRDVPGGRNYAEAILDALNEATLFLLIFSEDSNGSEHVQREVERALHLSKPIVPARIQDVMPSGAMDYYLATLHWLDVFCRTSGDASDENAEGVELGCQDVTRAVGSLLGREDKVEKGIAEKKRAREEAEERRRKEAEERELQIWLEAEARAKAELEAAARAKAEIEAEDRRRLEAEERQRKAEQEQRERERQRQKEERERQEKLQREKEEREQLRREKREREKLKQRQAIASGATGETSRGTVLLLIGLVLLMLLGGGWWAFHHFNSSGAKDAQAIGLAQSSASGADAPPAAPDRIVNVRASFQWMGEQHHIAAPELLKFVSEGGRGVGVGESIAGRLQIRIAADPAGQAADATGTFELVIPGFSPVRRQATLEEGDQDIDFGELARVQGQMVVKSAYVDQPRAAEIHRQWLKNVHVVWQGVALDDQEGQGLPESVVKIVEELQRSGPGAGSELSALSDEAVTVNPGTGSYAVFLETGCQAPFDRVLIAQLEVSGKSEAAEVTVPIVPIGVFGGTTQWTSTSTDSAQDDDGSVTWSLYNLPDALDFSSNGPRMVQSYVDIVDEGSRKKTIYLPAPITEVRFDSEKSAWRLRADPTEIVRKLVDDDLNDRYYEAIDFHLTHHADKRNLLFDAETVDQPLNATEGTVRSFPLTNAYPVFANSMDTLDAPHPGFGVVDVRAVYQHVEAISNKKNAEDYRRTMTMPFSSSKPLSVHLGVTPDRKFSGSGSMRIDAIENGSPAAAAGLKAGDLVVGIGGAEIGGVGDFYRVRFELPAGNPTEIKVLRDGREIAMAITPEAVAE